MLNLCLIVAHGTDGQRGGIDLAALAPVPDFTVPVTFFAQAVPHPGVKLFALARRAEEAWVAAQHLVAAVAGDMAKSLVDVDDVGPVSYTHLRAHETVLDLVCRLLLEKK